MPRWTACYSLRGCGRCSSSIGNVVSSRRRGRPTAPGTLSEYLRAVGNPRAGCLRYGTRRMWMASRSTGHARGARCPSTSINATRSSCTRRHVETRAGTAKSRGTTTTTSIARPEHAWRTAAAAAENGGNAHARVTPDHGLANASVHAFPCSGHRETNLRATDIDADANRSVSGVDHSPAVASVHTPCTSPSSILHSGESRCHRNFEIASATGCQPSSRDTQWGWMVQPHMRAAVSRSKHSAARPEAFARQRVTAPVAQVESQYHRMVLPRSASAPWRLTKPLSTSRTALTSSAPLDAEASVGANGPANTSPPPTVRPSLGSLAHPSTSPSAASTSGVGRSARHTTPP